MVEFCWLEFGSRFSIVGHSERRAIFGDTDEVVAAKFHLAMKAALTPILCVGESLAERESGRTEEVVWRQLQAVVAAHGVASLSKAILAYEPVWAIGTGRTASPAQAEEVHAFLRCRVSALDGAVGGNLSILYGGSVNRNNAESLVSVEDVDGVLVGGASLDADQWLTICRSAAEQ